ncbi:MAG: DUF4488 domain-containing protein [Bacteroidales bacterium]|nr:DUF4488 domain-containing protein [Bacteroidales bacterium]
MKKFLTILFVAFCSCTGVLVAQTDASSLVGVWQQHQLTTDELGNPHLTPVSLWKVMTADGSFYTFLIASKDAVAVKTNEGTYKLVGDSVIEESVTASMTAPAIVGNVNTLYYEQPHPDVLHVSYRLPKATRDAKEYWVRVKLGLSGVH